MLANRTTSCARLAPRLTGCSLGTASGREVSDFCESLVCETSVSLNTRASSCSEQAFAREGHGDRNLSSEGCRTAALMHRPYHEFVCSLSLETGHRTRYSYTEIRQMISMEWVIRTALFVRHDRSCPSCTRVKEHESGRKSGMIPGHIKEETAPRTPVADKLYRSTVDSLEAGATDQRHSHLPAKIPITSSSGLQSSSRSASPRRESTDHWSPAQSRRWSPSS